MPILTTAQAQAVYIAMSTLNNVAINDGSMSLEFHGTVDAQPARIQVTHTLTNKIRVSIGGGLLDREREEYGSQHAFAAAYGLDGKEPRTAQYTPGIGWQTVTKTGRHGNFDTEALALQA